MEVIDLFAFLRSCKLPIFMLKLDLEGFEADVLARMPLVLLSRISLLVLEEHHRPIDHARLASAGLTLWFQPLGSPRHFVYVNLPALQRFVAVA